MKRTLTTKLLRRAYQQGFFPMPDPETQEILWYNPDPRAIIPLEGFHVSKSLQRSIRNRGYKTTINEAFKDVILSCADRDDTWINEEIIDAYCELHHEGDAHSVEVWSDQQLVGGLYGVALGGAFFAESKFHRARDASKVALHHLVETMRARQMQLLEVQFLTEHLQTLGATNISSTDYFERLYVALTCGASFR